MDLKDIGEDGFIEGLRRAFAGGDGRLVKGIGDDTSVTTTRAGLLELSTTDILIEGTHFERSYTPAYRLGKKALAVSLSDIAAMGGRPVYMLVSLAVPPDIEKRFLDDLYRGIKARAAGTGIRLAGGNVARCPLVIVSTTVVGEVKKEDVVYRSGARPGDILYVTGTLGDSALGLAALREHGEDALRPGPLRRLALKHLDPAPRLEAGSLLASRSIASAMIDLSDGLLADLTHLSLASGVGAEVRLDRLPVSASLRKRGSMETALSGGEDYELLFTAPPSSERRIRRVAEKTGTRITAIGRITSPPAPGPSRKTAGAGVILVTDLNGRPVKMDVTGFRHF